MLRFLKSALFFLLLWLSVFGSAQDGLVTLSVQQGHSDDILLVTVSDDARFIASYDLDQKLIIWDAKSGNQLCFNYTDKPVHAIGFDTDNQNLLMAFTDGSGSLFIPTNTISASAKPVLNSKTLLETEIGKIEINLAEIKLLNSQTLVKIKSQTTTYFDQPFTSVVYSNLQQKIYASSEDGNIYVYDSKLIFLEFYKGHLSNVNDLVISKDQKFLYSASSDRSIIQWDLKENKIVRRFSGRSYMTSGASINPDGDKLVFGDELGFLKTISMSQSTMQISSDRKSIYPITFSAQTLNGKNIYAGRDNNLVVENENGKTKKIKAVKITPRLISHLAVVKGMKLYKPYYSAFYDVEISENNRWMIYLCRANGAFSPYYNIVDLNSKSGTKKRSARLYHEGHYSMNEPCFLNDSVFFTLDSDVPVDWFNVSELPEFKGLMFWKIKNENVKDIYQKKVVLNAPVAFAEKLNETKLLMLTVDSAVLSYDIETNTQAAENYKGITYIYYLKNNLAALVDLENKFHIVEFSQGKLVEKGLLVGHQDHISSCAYDKERNRLFSTSKDATIRIWDLNSYELIATIIPIGTENAIYVTPDNYYMTTSKDLNSFGFKVGEKYFYPEQFDPVFNRPDIVLDRLGYVDSTVISAYHQAYLKRIEKLGFTEEMLKTDFHLPAVEIINVADLSQSTNEDFIDLKLSLSDTKYPLDRINIWINDVAIFGTKGITLRSQNIQTLDTLIKIPLAIGLNKIQVSVLNQAGAESYKETTQITCTVGKEKPNLYLISIGCSNFKDSKYNLNFAAKDADDIATTFGGNKIYGEIFTKKLLNEEVTLENIQNLNSFLNTADINDEVILFFAGHGVLDQKLDYYLASYDMDFMNPSGKGIPYEAIEDVVDGIAPLKKIIFIDACHSGEVDKSEIEFSDSTDEVEDGDLTFRKVGNSVQQKEQALGLQSTSQLTKTLFADLRKGTGATVISSAGGMEFAIESNTWKNGLFTYCLLEGIESKKADLNRDGKIMLSEIQIYVGEQVMLLSKGRQQPTSRIENNSLDYRVW